MPPPPFRPTRHRRRGSDSAWRAPRPRTARSCHRSRRSSWDDPCSPGRGRGRRRAARPTRSPFDSTVGMCGRRTPPFTWPSASRAKWNSPSLSIRPSIYRESGGSLPVSIHSTRLRSVALYTGRKLTGFWRFAPIVSRPLRSVGIWATPASSYCRKLGEVMADPVALVRIEVRFGLDGDELAVLRKGAIAVIATVE